MYNKLFFISLFLFLSSQYLVSQVTIGSADSPVAGALLQLKQNENIGANSNLGLMLPRVSIIYSDDLTIDTNDKAEAYIGSVIYMANNICINNQIFFPGVYVWNGVQWESLNAESSNSSENKVWTTKDQDGNSFKAGRFKNQIWMLQNLQAKSFDTESETTITFPNAPTLTSPMVTIARRTASWCYTGPEGGTGLDPQFVDTYPEFGLIYSWILATGNANNQAYVTGGVLKNNNISQRAVNGISGIIGADEVENTQALTTGRNYIQGVCPNGWRLPSDRDFLILENELFYNPESYSYISNTEQTSWNPNSWQANWNKFENYNTGIYQSWRSQSGNKLSNLSQVMKTSCFPPLNGTNEHFIHGKSLSIFDGGLNILPTGDVTSSGLRRYGQWTYLMTSSFTAFDYDNNNLQSTYTPKYVARGFIFVDNLDGYMSDYDLVGNGNPDLGNANVVRCVYNNSEGFQTGMPESWSDIF